MYIIPLLNYETIETTISLLIKPFLFAKCLLLILYNLYRRQIVIKLCRQLNLLPNLFVPFLFNEFCLTHHGRRCRGRAGRSTQRSTAAITVPRLQTPSSPLIDPIGNPTAGHTSKLSNSSCPVCGFTPVFVRKRLGLMDWIIGKKLLFLWTAFMILLLLTLLIFIWIPRTQKYNQLLFVAGLVKAVTGLHSCHHPNLPWQRQTQLPM